MSRTRQPDTPRRHAAKSEAELAKVQGLRTSGAAGKHDSRPARQRTRANVLAAERRVNGWS